ncbi:RNA polymerase sigma factor [Dyadobacter endophyticus]|uniref:RNA polymerase sigma factor n=1 Tax=Dyadobacter TaxID=120831 RepID=UPI003CF17EB4
MSALLKEAPSDRQLLTEFQHGSEAAFEAIYNRYFPRLYPHALKMLRDPDEAQDLIQELFTAFWTKGRELDLTTSLSAYLYASTRNRVLNVFEHNRVHDHYVESLGHYLATVEASVDELVIEKELAEIIDAEISQMPPKMREIFELSRRENLSHREIAEMLSVSDKTVKKQVSKALKILKLKISYGFLLLEAYAQLIH